MTELLGIKVIWRSPKPGCSYTNYAELDGNFNEPIVTGCIFEEHPTQQTMKKIGWVSELSEDTSIIHVPYDLPGLEQGGLFEVPSGLDNAKPRLFRVIKLATSIVYPATVTCSIVPEYENTFNKSQFLHTDDHTNLLQEEHDCLF